MNNKTYIDLIKYSFLLYNTNVEIKKKKIRGFQIVCRTLTTQGNAMSNMSSLLYFYDNFGYFLKPKAKGASSTFVI